MAPGVAIAALPPARPPSVRRLMRLTLLAMLPGIAAHAWYFGPGALVQILLATLFALAIEALMLALRRRAIAPFLGDFSAPLTAILFALCMPPLAPWWIALVGMAAAIVVAKHVYGGLGANLFNPAMVGCAFVLVCFPHEFPAAPTANRSDVGIGLAWLVGGVFLLWKRVIRWQVPLATLATWLLLAMPGSWLEPDARSTSFIEPLPGHLLLAAFFVATDPVTGCITPRGRLAFGAGVGALAFAFDRWSGLPIAIPFAVLAMNCAAPAIDVLLGPRRVGISAGAR